jgi:hypothetical protein
VDCFEIILGEKLMDSRLDISRCDVWGLIVTLAVNE